MRKMQKDAVNQRKKGRDLDLKITVKDLINVLSELPDDVKDKTISSINGGSDAGVRVYQLELEGEKHKSYILVPVNKGDIAYDSYGKRQVTDE